MNMCANQEVGVSLWWESSDARNLEKHNDRAQLSVGGRA